LLLRLSILTGEFCCFLSRDVGAFAGGELFQDRVRRVSVGRRGADLGLTKEVADVSPLLWQFERDHCPCLAGSRCPPGAVEVCLVLDGWVGMDDEGDVVDVDSPSGDVRRNECLYFA